MNIGLNRLAGAILVLAAAVIAQPALISMDSDGWILSLIVGFVLVFMGFAYLFAPPRD